MLAANGIRPTEKITARATTPRCQKTVEFIGRGRTIQRWLMLIFNSRGSGIGKINRTRSVKTLMDPWAMLNPALSKEPFDTRSMFHVVDIGMQENTSALATLSLGEQQSNVGMNSR